MKWYHWLTILATALLAFGAGRYLSSLACPLVLRLRGEQLVIPVMDGYFLGWAVIAGAVILPSWALWAWIGYGVNKR